MLWLYSSILIFMYNLIWPLSVVTVQHVSTLDQGPLQRGFGFASLLGYFVNELLLLGFELEGWIQGGVFGCMRILFGYLLILYVWVFVALRIQTTARRVSRLLMMVMAAVLHQSSRILNSYVLCSSSINYWLLTRMWILVSVNKLALVLRIKKSLLLHFSTLVQ